MLPALAPDEQLAAGAIAGIVVGAVVVVAALSVTLVVLRKRIFPYYQRAPAHRITISKTVEEELQQQDQPQVSRRDTKWQRSHTASVGALTNLKSP